MSLVIYLNGEFVKEEEAKISVFDHGLLYGDGVFEGLRSYNGKIFKLDEHLVRLYNSAKAILLEIPLKFEELKNVIVETVKRNNLKDSYIRVVVTRGVGDLGLDPRKCPKPTIFVIASSIQLYPETLYERGVDVVTVPTRRILHESLNPAIKSLNYLNNILAKIEATNAGATEGLILNQFGYVSECTGENIFIIKENILKTPPVSAGILEGVTRKVVMDIGKNIGLEVKEENLTRYDIYTSDECFLTGTAAEIVPVVSVDKRIIGDGRPGKITKKIRKEFQIIIELEGFSIYE
jgi:branched-chain amino acid aminotransferase